MADKFFDVAVIAEGLNALLAAYELSKGDVSIAVIDNYKPSLTIDGYDFNYYPEHLFAPHELPGIFQELHVAFEVYTSPAYQMILPDRRIDMHCNVQKLLKAVGLRFADGPARLEEYLYKEQRICDLLSQGTGASAGGHTGRPERPLSRLLRKELLRKESRSADRSLGDLKGPGPVSVFISAIERFMAPWLSGRGPSAHRAIAPLLLRKRFYPVGGKGSLKAALINELAKRNVNIIQGEGVTSIEHGRYFTTTFAHEQTVRSRRLIVEPIYEKTASLLPSGPYGGIKKRFYVDNIFIGLRRSCLPGPYGRVNSAVMVCDYDRPPENDNLIFMDTNPLTDIKRAKDEMAALTATLLITENSISRISSIRHAAIERIRWFMPFFDGCVENVYFTEPSIVWDGGRTPVYKKGLMLINDEFINLYTGDEKYAYIKKQAERLVKTL
ncbi:MAG: hypothetical protein M1517_06725 [Deltaproteobacteria bacterium]|nr:hypothetical protein [Deltaproteobacteria bacterium]